MGVATARPTNFVEGKGYPSPVTHVIGFGYYDGVTDGMLQTADGSVFRFEMTGESPNPDGLDLRTFDLSPLPAGVFEQAVSLLSPYSSPNWPVWVPLWKFPTDEIRKQVDEQIDRWLASAGPPAWRVESVSLDDTVVAAVALPQAHDGREPISGWLSQSDAKREAVPELGVDTEATYLENIPPDLRPAFQGLHNDFVWLCLRWKRYCQLFAVGPNRIELLNKTAPAFFGELQQILLEDVTLGICRLTDRHHFQDKRRLVLEQLITELDPNRSGELVAKLSEKLLVVRDTARPFRDRRNEKIAHRDLDVALNPENGTGISREMIRNSLKEISEFLNLFRSAFNTCTIVYIESITALGDAEGLVACLKGALGYRKLMRSGTAPALDELVPEYRDA